MIPLSATILIVALAVSTDIILEIGSEITAATLDDPNMGAQIEPTAPCLLYTSPSPRDLSTSRMPSSA